MPQRALNGATGRPISAGCALIDDSTRAPTGKRIRRRPRLGGLLNYYERAA